MKKVFLSIAMNDSCNMHDEKYIAFFPILSHLSARLVLNRGVGKIKHPLPLAGCLVSIRILSYCLDWFARFVEVSMEGTPLPKCFLTLVLLVEAR